MTDLALPYFTAAPLEPTGRGVVLAHEGFGMNAQIMRVTERLAAEGYTVVAPEFFYRSGGPEAGDYWDLINGHTPDQLRADLAAAIAALRAQGAATIGVTGFCFGGRVSYFAARWADELGVDAAVSFYPGRIADKLGELHCPTLMLFAGRDEYVPPEDIAAAQARHGDVVTVYLDSSHGFMRDGWPDYDPRAAPDAWARLLAFFGEYLDPSRDRVSA
jgi:carboxymethylenebutenolidase